MSKKTESPETTVPDEVAVLPCVGACRGDETEHEILTPKMARCSVCKHERNTLVGAGSPAGPRWFVTKYPSWTATIIPEDYLLGEGGRTVKQKALRAVFKRIVKPRKLVDTQGELGSENPGGGDRNASRWMGVFSIVDPGQNPTDKNGILARKVIDFLRGHEQFRKTTQDNRLSANPELSELNWDPQLKKTAEGAALNRRVSLDQSDESVPIEEAPEAQKARVGATARRILKTPVGAGLGEGE